MNRSEQLEHEAEATRLKLAALLVELRQRTSPGQMAHQVIDYVREGPASEFLHNVGREVRENPLPLMLIGVGIAWSVLASWLRSSGPETECAVAGTKELTRGKRETELVASLTMTPVRKPEWAVPPIA